VDYLDFGILELGNWEIGKFGLRAFVAFINSKISQFQNSKIFH